MHYVLQPKAWTLTRENDSGWIDDCFPVANLVKILRNIKAGTLLFSLNGPVAQTRLGKIPENVGRAYGSRPAGAGT